MKTIIAGDRNVVSLEIIKKAIVKSGFVISEVISGGARGSDSLGEEWAKQNKITVKEFPAKWNDFTLERVIEKKNKWGKAYNAAAGFVRNEEMARYADACIAIQINGPTPGTQDMIKLAKKYKLKLYVYEKDDEDYKYEF